MAGNTGSTPSGGVDINMRASAAPTIHGALISGSVTDGVIWRGEHLVSSDGVQS